MSEKSTARQGSSKNALGASQERLARKQSAGSWPQRRRQKSGVSGGECGKAGGMEKARVGGQSTVPWAACVDTSTTDTMERGAHPGAEYLCLDFSQAEQRALANVVSLALTWTL